MRAQQQARTRNSGFAMLQEREIETEVSDEMAEIHVQLPRGKSHSFDMAGIDGLA